MDTLLSLFARNGYLPHGTCFTWTPGLLWSMVGADAVIAAAYFSIPVAIVSFVRQRGPSATNWVPWLFSAFIFACGTTHLLDIWTIWQPDYAAQAASKLVTAAISLTTAIALWPLMPRALNVPSVARLQSVIRTLELEVQRRVTAEEQLVDTQQSLAVTLATIGAAFIAMDRAGRVVRMNAVAEALTGWAEAQAAGQPFWLVFDRDNRPPELLERNPVDVLLENGDTIDVAHHLTLRHRDGRLIPLEVKIGPTRAGDGTVRGAVVVFRDLTGSIRAASESSRLSAIVESSDDAIISKTLDGRITTWNGAAEAMFGYSAEEAVGHPVQMLIPPDREAEEMQILARLSHGERVPPFTTVRRTKGGRLLDVSITISPIRDDRGRIVGASKIARDVTQARRAEAALRDSEARLRFTLESAQIGDWDLDLATGIAQRSVRHDRCFGYERYPGEWCIGTFLAHVHLDDRAEVECTFRDAVDGLRDWRVDCRVVWPDASVHWIRVFGSMRREADAATHMLGIVIDITEQKHAEAAHLNAQRLESENRQIQEANRLKSLFLANMSHELRTPLNAIIGFAELMHAGAVPAESPKHREFLGHIASSGHHLLQLINDVLDLSKVESGKFEFYPEAVNLPQLVREVTDVLHTGIQRKGLAVKVEIEPAVAELELDPARLKQVLYNYLSNAIKFTPQGGNVVVRARAEGAQHVRLEVEDDGIGIAAADLPRLFVEFQQLDAGSTKQHQGTGLGLALTRRLVQAQGGAVGVRSAPGRGSAFHLVLGRRPGAPPMQQQGPDARAHGEHLLAIEAPLGGTVRLASALRDAGFRVDTAARGDEALQQAQRQSYAAITLDLLLPDQPGLGVLAGIRREGPSQGTPVVAVSMPADANQAARFAIADVLAKPVGIVEVATAMARLPSPAGRALRVMVVDDDPVARDLMSTSLAGLGIAVTAWPGGREALDALEVVRPDAIVLDLMMPGFDGFEVLDALHRLPAWRDTPVFVWTSMLLTDEEYERLAASARAILVKGGGALAPLLENLRRWRPPLTVAGEGGTT